MGLCRRGHGLYNAFASLLITNRTLTELNLGEAQNTLPTFGNQCKMIRHRHILVGSRTSNLDVEMFHDRRHR